MDTSTQSYKVVPSYHTWSSAEIAESTGKLRKMETDRIELGDRVAIALNRPQDLQAWNSLYSAFILGAIIVPKYA